MDIKKFAIDVLRLLLGSAWNRTGSGLAIIGASALTGWIDQVVAHLLGFKLEQTTPWIGFAVMIIGVAMLAIGIQKETTPAAPPNPHDVTLIGQFRELVTNNVLDFLANHNFNTPWRRTRLDAVGEIAEVWRGARYEFQDEALNAALTKVKASANSLEASIAYGSWPTYDNPEVQTVKTDEDYQIGTQPATIQKIAEMNRLKARLLADIDDLERLARRIVPV